MPLLPLLLLGLAPAAAATSAAAAAASKQIFHATEPTDVFSSALVSLHPPGAPTFAVAADNGAPYLAVYSGATGALAWRWASPCAGCALSAASARHAQADAAAPGRVDLFAIQSGDAGATCEVLGFDSSSGAASGAATPAWRAVLPGCSALAQGGSGGTYTGIAASDDGRSVAVLGYGADAPGGNLTARAYLLAGQTGALAWTYDLGARERAGQGDIAIGRDFVCFINEDSLPNPNSAQMHVLAVATGALRAEVQVPFFIAGAISDDGQYVAVQNFTHLLGSEPWVLQWSAGTGAYELLHRLALPPDGTEYDLWDISIPAGPASYVALGWISAIPSALALRVTAHDLASGALLTDWSAPRNTQLQNNPTLRTDGEYIGVGLWGGDAGAGAPTAVVLRAGRNDTVFSATSSGSMFAVDLAVEAGALYLAAAGKHVVRGGGGLSAPAARARLFSPAGAHTSPLSIHAPRRGAASE